MLTAVQVLADNNFGDTRDPGGLAGPMGLFLVVVLGVATVLLIRNMNARLRRLPERFPGHPDAEGANRGETGVLDLTEAAAVEESGGSAPSASDLPAKPQSAS